MFLKIDNEIINTDQLIYAELREDDAGTQLYVRLAGGGSRELTYTSRTYEDETARAIWKVLNRNITEIDINEPDGIKKKPIETF